MKYHTLSQAIDFTMDRMRNEGEIVHTEKWQGFDIKENPSAKMVEIINHSFSAPINTFNLLRLQNQIRPNIPWADDHFEERMCGAPINPGKEWANWPWADKADESRDQEMFNHNYMERYWPKYAGFVMEPTVDEEDWQEKASEVGPLTHMVYRDKVENGPNRGIRHKYGDVMDVLMLLSKEPLTRQAYLPIWFPEDTGYRNEGRKPCTLGYHFIMRNGKLHINYYIRSCDLVRHFRDDIYMTVRLLLRFLNRLRDIDFDTWGKVEPGDFTMHITSLHMFLSDFQMTFKANPNENK